MPRVDYCNVCGQHEITVEASDGARVCVRCLRTLWIGAELRSIIEADDARDDERARAAGVQDKSGYIVVASDDMIHPA